MLFHISSCTVRSFSFPYSSSPYECLAFIYHLLSTIICNLATTMFVLLPSVRILTSPVSRICPPNQDLFSYAFVFVLVLFIYVPTLLYYFYFIYININLSSVCVSIIFSPPFTFLSLFTSHVNITCGLSYKFTCALHM